MVKKDAAEKEVRLYLTADGRQIIADHENYVLYCDGRVYEEPIYQAKLVPGLTNEEFLRRIYENKNFRLKFHENRPDDIIKPSEHLSLRYAVSHSTYILDAMGTKVVEVYLKLRSHYEIVLERHRGDLMAHSEQVGAVTKGFEEQEMQILREAEDRIQAIRSEKMKKVKELQKPTTSLVDLLLERQ